MEIGSNELLPGVVVLLSVIVLPVSAFGHSRRDFALRALFAPSSVEQPAEASVSMEEVNRWLNSRGDLPSSPDLERLRAAVVVLSRKPKPRQEDVQPLCATWNVRRMEHKKSRPLATLITELQQAVLAEWNKLRGSLDVLPGASASSAEQPAGPAEPSSPVANGGHLRSGLGLMCMPCSPALDGSCGTHYRSGASYPEDTSEEDPGEQLPTFDEGPPPVVLTNPPQDYDPFQSQPQPWTANDWDHVWETSGNLDFDRDVFNEAAEMQLATAATPAVASHDGLTGAPQEDVSSISSDGNMSTNSSDD